MKEKLRPPFSRSWRTESTASVSTHSICRDTRTSTEIAPLGFTSQFGVDMKTRILILCTGNSARSQIAEGLFRAKGGTAVEVESAGIQPKRLNPLAVQVMKEIGIDISAHRSKDVSEFQNDKFDVVITVCDNA